MSRRAMPPPDLFGERPEPEGAERANLVDRPVYLPRSLTELHGGEFTLPRWLAVEKGLA